jgi:hypothetical protein
MSSGRGAKHWQFNLRFVLGFTTAVAFVVWLLQAAPGGFVLAVIFLPVIIDFLGYNRAAKYASVVVLVLLICPCTLFGLAAIGHFLTRAR